jgi:hypothetical protein
MAEVRYNKSHPAGPDAQARINNRLKSSGSDEADSVTKVGSGAQRVFHQVHLAGNAGRRDDGKRVGPLTAGNKDRDL